MRRALCDELWRRVTPDGRSRGSSLHRKQFRYKQVLTQLVVVLRSVGTYLQLCVEVVEEEVPVERVRGFFLGYSFSLPKNATFKFSRVETLLETRAPVRSNSSQYFFFASKYDCFGYDCLFV